MTLLVHFPPELVRQTPARRWEDATILVVETNIEHATVVTELDGNLTRTDDIDVTELHSLVELEVSENTEQDLEEPIHHASRYEVTQENASCKNDGTLCE